MTAKVLRFRRTAEMKESIQDRRVLISQTPEREYIREAVRTVPDDGAVGASLRRQIEGNLFHSW